MEEQEIKELLEKRIFRREYVEGRLNFHESLGTPQDFKVDSISDRGLFYDFFKNPEDAQDIIESTMKVVNSFQDYLNRTKLNNQKPDIHFDFPTSEKDLEIPKLDGFSYDNRIFVKPLKRIARKYEIEGSAHFGFFKKPFKILYYDWSMPQPRRNCGIDSVSGEGILNLQRLPILLNCDFPIELVRSSGLAHDILLDQFEPYTSNRILDDAIDFSERYENPNRATIDIGFEKSKKNRRYEEKLVANAIIRDWLFKTKSNDPDINRMYVPIEFEEHNCKALEQLQKKGIEKVVDFYISEDWNLKCFLKGHF